MLGWKLFSAGGDHMETAAICQDVGTSMSAAGTTQATATELVNCLSDVTTVASGSGVILASKATPGDSQIVLNSGANVLKVYPPVGAKINNLTLNTAIVVPINSSCEFWCISLTKWAAVLSA